MTQPENHDDGLLAEVKDELVQIDASEISDAVERYEQLHTKLSEALSTIEGM